MVSISKGDIKDDISMQPEGEPGLDKMDQLVHDYSNSKFFIIRWILARNRD